MSIERQTSFAAGELAPGLHGRTDLASYPIGAATLRNFFVNPLGNAVNRPGTTMVAKLGSSAGGTYGYWGSAGRLIPFNYSDEDSVIFAVPPDGGSATLWRRVGKQTAHVLRSGGYLILLGVGFPAVDVTLRKLRYAQVGNVLWLVHPEFRPREFKRTSIDPEDWAASNLSFDVPEFPTYGGRPAVLIGPGGYSDTSGDESFPAREWQWAVSHVMRDASGRVYETLPRSVGMVLREFSRWKEGKPYGYHLNAKVYHEGIFYTSKTQNNRYHPTVAAYWDVGATGVLAGPMGLEVETELLEQIAVYPTNPKTITWDTFAELGYEVPGPDDDRIISTRIYRGREGRLGYIGETIKAFFVDEGQEPNFSSPPLSGENPFKVYDGEGTLLRTEHPSVIALHENRLILASTSERPTVVWGSAVGAYNLFDRVQLPDAADSFNHEIASHRLEAIKGLVSRRELLVLTSSSEWLLQGADGGLITPTSVAAHPLSEHGCADLAPLAVGDTVFFVQRKGTVPRAIVPADARQGWAARDVATLSSHLFVGHTIVDWAYQEDPWKILWLVRDDGVLLSLTYVPEHELAAWAQHEITGGLVESIATIPEGTEDAVYLIVNREGTRHLERMASRVVNDIRDAMFLDSAVTYDGRNTDPTQTATIADAGTGGAIFETVNLTLANEDSVGSAEGKYIQIDGVVLQVGAHAGASVYSAVVQDPKAVPDALFGVAQSDWAWCTNTVAGLAHLNGQTVNALVDGYVVKGLTVNASAVTLGNYAGVIHVGLPYDSDLVTLAAMGERGKPKVVPHVTLEFEGARGGLIGQELDEDNMEAIPTRDAYEDYGPVALGRWEHRIPIPNEYQSSGSVAYRNKAPLPVTILGLMRELVSGGR